MVHVSIFNIWLSVGLYVCRTIPYVPPTQFGITTFHLSLRNIKMSLQLGEDVHYNITKLMSLPSKLSTTVVAPQLTEQIHILRLHLDDINALLELDQLLLKPPNYIPGHTILSPSLNRTKRGLFDFVGKVQKTLFGVATTRDLDEIVSVIKRTMATGLEQQQMTINLFNLTNHRIDQNTNQISQVTKLAQALFLKVNQQALSTDLFHEAVSCITHIRQIVEELDNIKVALTSLRQLSLSHHNTLIIDRIQDLLLSTHQLSPPYPLDQLATSKLHSFYWDGDDIILNVLMSDKMKNKSEVPHQAILFQPSHVGAGGVQFTLAFKLSSIILDASNSPIGMIDPLCADWISSFWEIQSCPMIPLPHSSVKCLTELVKNETASQCPLTLNYIPWPLQETCDGQWIIDSGLVKCPSQHTVSGNNTLILKPNINVDCEVDGTSFTIPSSPNADVPKKMVPLMFLLHSHKDLSNLDDYHPQTMDYALTQLATDISIQTGNWLHLQNLSSNELQHYLQLAKDDIHESKEYLESIHWKKYSSSWWETMLTQGFPILGALAFCEINAVVVLMYLKIRGAGASVIRDGGVIIQDRTLAIADWALVIPVCFCLLWAIFNWYTKRSRRQLLSLVLLKENLLLQSGLSYVSLVVHGTRQDGSQYKVNVVIGQVLGEVSLLGDEDLDSVQITLVQKKFLCIPYGRKMMVHHTGIYQDTYSAGAKPVERVFFVPISKKCQIGMMDRLEAIHVEAHVMLL